MKKLTIVIVAIILALLPSSCRKERISLKDRQFKFNATTERPYDEQAKVYLKDENFIMWEYDDSISIGSNATNADDHCVAWLYYSAGEDWTSYNGVFLTTLPEGSQYFLGLHPCNRQNVIAAGSGSAFSTVKINLPETQTYRNDAMGDFTFDKQVFPMVAWYGGEWGGDPYTPFNLDFHSLGAIVRLQFVNKTGDASTLDRIVFTSEDKQLSGAFTVNNYNTNDPSLTGLDASKKTVTINCENLAFANNGIATFYLVLPAIAGRETRTEYTLTATVYNTAGQSRARSFRVNTRRNGITYMQALEITSWTDGTPAASISGNGTAERPFKVYTIDDLVYLRDCYNSVAPRTINGQPITENTNILIMRSDIVLTNITWNRGIADFAGKITDVSTGSTHGITNNSTYPLFENILSTGKVKGLTVKSNSTHTGTNDFSPFCTQNGGTIEDCAITSTTGISSSMANLAGIVVTNNFGGKIKGCRCSASLSATTAGKVVAGICLTNIGKIQGCMSATPMTVPTASKAGGIVYKNNEYATVADCYFAASITNTASTINWGGIVYDNEGVVNNCYISHTASILTSGTVGGIVHDNKGTINYCWSESRLRGSSVGAIADSISAGHIINCFVNYSEATIVLSHNGTSSAGGGLVAVMTGGKIQNSFVNNLSIIRLDNTDPIGGIVGEAWNGSITNCYANSSNNSFYGTTSNKMTYSRCYLVGGTQTSIANISSSQATAPAANAERYPLINLLNANGKPDGSYSWTNTSGTYPVLVPDSASSGGGRILGL